MVLIWRRRVVSFCVFCAGNASVGVAYLWDLFFSFSLNYSVIYNIKSTIIDFFAASSYSFAGFLPVGGTSGAPLIILRFQTPDNIFHHNLTFPICLLTALSHILFGCKMHTHTCYSNSNHNTCNGSKVSCKL